MEAYSAFHNYSIGNQILALVQCHGRGLEAGPINTFPGWQAVGRIVKRGERALTLYVFTNPDTGTRYTDIKKSFSAACREAGITNFTFHDLRHTFGTRLADAGVDVVKIKELMGHASIVTTMR